MQQLFPPTVSSMVAPTVQHARFSLPAAVLAIRLDPAADLDSPDTLTRACVAVSVAAHPVLHRALLRAGAALRPGGGYHLELRSPDPLPDELAAALHCVHPERWITDGSITLPTPAAVTEPKRRAATHLSVRLAGGRLRIRPEIDPKLLHGLGVQPGPARRVRLLPGQALSLLSRAEGSGVLVVDDNAPGRLRDLAGRYHATCVLTPLPGAPGYVTIDGLPLDAKFAGPHPVADLPALLRALPGRPTVAVAPLIRDMLATLAAEPAGRPGLHPWQDAAVSAFLASGAGLVNALPPGSGKTVCAAAGLADRAAVVVRHRALVLAPAGLHGQWAAELARFHPSARLVTISGRDDLPALLNAWNAADTALVAILSPELLARNAGTLDQLAPHDLVVDEATFLSGDGAAAATVWAMRRRAGHALVLTGTPDTRRTADTARLVAFARNDRALAAPAAAGRGPDRFGPLLHRGVPALPATELAVHQLPASELERSVNTTALASLRAALKKPPSAAGTRQLRADLTAWRLGLASPAALARSRYPLAATLGLSRSGPPETGTRLAWAVRRCVEAAADGTTTLLFSDFLPVLADADAHLRAAGLRAAVLSSAARAAQRAELLTRFTSGELDVLLLSAAGERGLNLQTAGTVIHLDLPFSPATWRQRPARAARLGRTGPVPVHAPVLGSTAEPSLLTLLESGSPAGGLRDLAALLAQGRRRS